MNEFLQVKYHENVFAMGDCTNVKEKKLVLTAEAQAECLAQNLRAMMRGDSMRAYKPGEEVGREGRRWSGVAGLGSADGKGGDDESI